MTIFLVKLLASLPVGGALSVELESQCSLNDKALPRRVIENWSDSYHAVTIISGPGTDKGCVLYRLFR